MTVIARRIASSPLRSAMNTWVEIVALLAPDSASSARAELAGAAGVASASISSEATADEPIVVWGTGPRVRIYCVFGEDAVVGKSVNEDPLVSCPTDGEWSMSIPCPPEDVDWSERSLRRVTTRISARAVGEEVQDAEDTSAQSKALTIDPKEFLRS